MSTEIQSSESVINDTSNSISPIEIPLVSSQPILAVSSNSIFVNEETKKRKQLILINDHLQKFPTHSTITEIILDRLWYDIKKKFFLLTPTKIFTYDPKTMIIESIPDIEPTDNKPFKCFTVSNKQSSLLIGYDEWKSKVIERWEQNNENGLWKLIERYPLKLTSNEFIGSILGINQDDSSNLAITIYNNFTNQWRMEIQDVETSKCLRKILLPSSDSRSDYRMIFIENARSDIKWLIHSPDNNKIIGIDSKWQKIYLKYKFPIHRMAQFRKNLIIRTTNKIDILLFT
jgi:hypothetical protein